MQAIDASQPAAADAWRIRLVFCLTASAVVASTLLAFGDTLLNDPDTWWHVRVGLDILSSRSLPTVDVYSHTHAGQPWIAKEWLAQVLMAAAYASAGWNGVVVAAVAAIASTVFLTCWYLSASLKPTIALAASVMTALLVGPVFVARPHILTLPIIVVWTAVLFDAARREHAPPLWLLPLIWLWSNLHATFTLGFVIAAFAGLDLLARTRLRSPRLLARWIVFGLLCPVVTLINPYGFKAILATFSVAYGNEAVPYILEWQPFSVAGNGLQEAAILAMIFGLFTTGLKIGWPRALFLIFTLHVYLLHLRFVYLFFLLAPLVIAPEVAQQFPSLSARRWAEATRDRLELFLRDHTRIAGGAIAAALLVGTAAVLNAAAFVPSSKNSAEKALAFARDRQLSGNVLNSYDFGGTLIFHGIRTYVDGRTDQLFLDGFMRRDVESGATGGKPLLEELLRTYRIEWALLAADDDRIAFFNEMPAWKRAYADEDAVIYLRGD